MKEESGCKKVNESFERELVFDFLIYLEPVEWRDFRIGVK